MYLKRKPIRNAGTVYIYANSDVMKSMQLFTEWASSQLEDGLSDLNCGFPQGKNARKWFLVSWNYRFPSAEAKHHFGLNWNKFLWMSPSWGANGGFTLVTRISTPCICLESLLSCSQEHVANDQYLELLFQTYLRLLPINLFLWVYRYDKISLICHPKGQMHFRNCKHWTTNS